MSMDPERPDVQEASEILDECAALPHADRAAFLTGRCAGRDALRREVESLLGYLHDPEFEDGDPKDDEMARARRRMGSEIGGCRLLELLAIGGMGAVYRAEQESPRREVALKLLRPDGLGTDAWRRLNREALALGRLDHPAIARVFTAGIHRDAHGATPFLTMELVEGGRPISRWWRETALPIAARLELFANVCEAIHHGHIKGVLHRDVKPGNLLVDRDDRPKVIDFGIARVIEPGTDDSTAPVTGGRVIGTILYMAPERLEGDGQVDVRSDVYGLGVVLYELLAGRLPFGEWGGSLAATAAAVVRGEAPPPSSFDRRFRGDLDAIVAKAMALDPADRYDSASALAADLRAHLRDEPIRADRSGRIVQARKFLRRNRIGVAAVLGIVVALAIGLAVSLRSTARAERALYLALLAQGDLTVARNDVGSTLRILQSLGPDREEEWPVRMLRRATDDTVDSAMFGEWNLFRGRLDADRRRLLASGWGERPELVVLGTSPVAVVDRIPLPSTGMGADWGPRRVDGPETVIAGLDDGRVVEVQVTDGAIRREIATIAPDDKPTTSGQISDVALAPCGRRLAIGHSSDSVRLVDLVDGSILDVDGFADPVSPNWVFVDWSPDGESLAVAATGGTFLVDAATGSMRKLSGRAANQAAFSPDGARIASALSVGATEMIDVATGTADIIVEALWPIWGVDWSPDGKHIAMVGRSHWIILFDVAARSRRMFKSEANPVWTARWSTPTEVMTLPLGHEFSLQAPYQRISSIRRTIGDLDRWELRLRFADGGRSLVCTVPGGRIERIDPLIETRTVIATVPIDQPSTDATPDGATIVVADALEPGPLWVVETGDGSARRIDGEFLGPVAISPDLQRVVAVGPKGEATVIDLGSGAVEARFDRPTFTKTVSFAWIGPEAVAWCQPNGASRLFRGGDGGWSLHHDPDASLLEAWSRDHAWYWTDLSLRVVRSGSDRLGDHTAPESLRGLGIVLCMAAHPTLPLVAFGTSDGRIAIYDESIDTIVANYQVVARRITDIAWSPDGSMLAGIDLGGGIRFIDSEPLSSRWPEIKRRRAEAETGGLPFGRPGP